MKKKYFSYFLAVLLSVCLLASMTPLAYAAGAAAAALQIGGNDVAQISVEASSDVAVINSVDNKYTVTVNDKPNKNCDGDVQSYEKQSDTLTFTNKYNGYVDITSFTITGGELINITDCQYVGADLRMKKGGSFQITVVSPGNDINSSVHSTTVELGFVNIVPEPLDCTISFAEPTNGTLTVTDKDGKTVTGSGTSSYFKAIVKPSTTDYEVYRWEFKKTSDNSVTVVGGNTNVLEYYPEFDGEISCVMIKTDTAKYTVNSVEYVFLDEAINAAKSASTTNTVIIEVTGSGTVYGSAGTTDFTIPSNVRLVLPHEAGKTGYSGTTLSSTSYFPYGIYTQHKFSSAGNSYYIPCAPSTSKTLKIPTGTIVTNHGQIAVGGTLVGNAASYGSNNYNLIVDGELKLPSSTSILSVCGHVTGGGIVEATGDGAKIFQPMVLLRPDNWGWSLGAAGKEGIFTTYGMETWATDASKSSNPAPLYTTQNIQCDVTISYGATMYGYISQYCNSEYYETTSALIGKGTGLIGLKSGTTLTAEYDGGKVSTKSDYSGIGKLTLTIDGGGTGGATMGTASASISGVEIKLDQWPFPVPYNYDIVLKNGIYDVGKDLTLLPGAGLKVDSDATLNITSSMAVFTGAYDHSIQPSLSDGKKSTRSSVTVSYGGSVSQSGGKQAAANKFRYPRNNTLAKVSTLNEVSGGSLMANFIVNGTLNISGSFGGIVQTTDTSKAVINMNVQPGTIKRHLGMAGQCSDASDAFAHAGQTIYKFEPQLFGVNGELLTMQNGTIYRGANTDTTTIKTFSFDLYTKSGTATSGSTEVDAGKESHPNELIGPNNAVATAKGQWGDTLITFNANGGTGAMDGQGVLSGVAATLTKNEGAITHPEGMEFDGWKDDDGKTYADGATITVDKDTTLYAQWTEAVTSKVPTANDFTVTVPDDLVYDGTAKNVTVSVKEDITGMGEISVKYLDASGSEVEAADVKNAGTYTYTVSVAEGESYTAAVDVVTGEFTITAKTVTPTVVLSETECTYDGKEKTPDVTLKDGDVDIPDGEYTVAYSANTNAGEATVTVTDKDGGNYSFEAVEAKFTIKKAEQAAPTVTGNNETISGKQDGSISGVTNEMEWSSDDGKTWTSVSGTELTKLAAGTYQIRYAENENYNASSAASVTIAAGPKLTITWKNWDGTKLRTDSLDFGAEITKPADPTRPADKCKSYVFKDWGKQIPATVTGNLEFTAVYTETVVHTWVEADCDTPKTCSVCKATEGKALGHSWVDADCDTPKTCSVCKATEGEALGHNYKSVVTPPSFDAAGYTTHTCTRCDDSYKDSYVDALIAVAKIGEDRYTTLEAAFEAAEEGDVIVLLTEAVVEAEAEWDLTDMTVTAHADGIVVKGSLTIKGGTFHAAEESDELIVNYGTLIIENGEFSGTISNAENGTAAVSGGTFSHKLEDSMIAKSSHQLEKQKTVDEGETIIYYQVEAHKAGEAKEENRVEASCSAGGSYDLVVRCTVPECDAVLSTEHKIIDKLPHTAVDVEAVAPDCTNTGLTAGKKCSKCGEVIEAQGIVDALGHKEEIIPGKDATCTESGLTEGKYCTVCKQTTVEQNVINPLEHAWVPGDGVCDCSRCDAISDHNWVETEVDGVVTVACSKCGQGCTEHQYEAVVTPPTCTVDGYTTHTCTICGHSYTDTPVAAGHTAGEAVIENKMDATCTDDGSYDTVVRCSVCTAELSRNTTTVPATGHDHKETVTAPTCTAKGYTTYTCACGDTYKDNEVAALGHDEVSHEAKAPTCKETGWNAYVTCNRCDYTTYEELPVTEEHTEETIPGYAATCTAPGMTDGTKCSVCEKVLVEQKEISALAHDLVNHEAKAPTCTEAGWNAYETCTRCEHSTKVEIPATGEHEYETEVTAPTCVDKGYTTYTCTGCGDSYVDDEVPATGKHSYVDGVCGVCGDREVKLTQFIKSVSVDLGNSLALKFIIDPDLNDDGVLELTGNDNYAVISKLVNGTWTIVKESPQSEWDTYTNERFAAVYDDIAARHMADKFKIVLYNKSGEAISVEYEDTVRDYAKRGVISLSSLSNPTAKQLKQLTMFVDFLNYGAAAQVNFNYNTGDLANSVLTEEHQKYATLNASAENKREGDGGTAVSVESRIELGFTFSKTLVTQDMYAVVSYTKHTGTLYNATIMGADFEDYSSTKWRIPVFELSTADGNQMITCTIYDAEGNRVAQAKDSINSYMARVLAASNASANLKALATEALKLTASAYAYFH